MAIQLSLPQILVNRSASLEERIQGTQAARVIGEFVGTSALFPVVDAIRVIATEGWLEYLKEPAHYILFGAAFVQAWFLGTAKSERWQIRFIGNLLGFSLYVPIDMVIEGPHFFSQPYHWLFGSFSLLLAILSALQSITKELAFWQIITTLLLNICKISLFPAIYLITELQLELSAQLTLQIWQDYLTAGGHRFIFYGALFFGVLLGLTEAQRLHYAGFLRDLAGQLKQYSEWSLGADLIANSLDNPDTLDLRRVERTILFMDIRGFTAWTEQTNPQQAVQMLNQYYNAAEAVIINHQGHKPNFTADEIMTRFTNPQLALNAALDLQKTLNPLLVSFNLAVGVGLHTGEVIEGLLGSDTTRKYDIIGDVVNTAKRLESAAGRGEIVISAATYYALPHLSTPVTPRALQVKGKAQALQVFVINSEVQSGF
jgi:class 3 adenylate cyclase